MHAHLCFGVYFENSSMWAVLFLGSVRSGQHFHLNRFSCACTSAHELFKSCLKRNDQLAFFFFLKQPKNWGNAFFLLIDLKVMSILFNPFVRLSQRWKSTEIKPTWVGLNSNKSWFLWYVTNTHHHRMVMIVLCSFTIKTVYYAVCNWHSAERAARKVEIWAMIYISTEWHCSTFSFSRISVRLSLTYVPSHVITSN